MWNVCCLNSNRYNLKVKSAFSGCLLMGFTLEHEWRFEVFVIPWMDYISPAVIRNIFKTKQALKTTIWYQSSPPARCLLPGCVTVFHFRTPGSFNELLIVLMLEPAAGEMCSRSLVLFWLHGLCLLLLHAEPLPFHTGPLANSSAGLTSLLSTDCRPKKCSYLGICPNTLGEISLRYTTPLG